MSWLFWSSEKEQHQQEREEKKEEEKEEKKEEKKETNEPDYVADLLKIDLKTMDDDAKDIQKLHAARKPVIEAFQKLYESYHAGEYVLQITSESYHHENAGCVFVGRRQQIQDIHRYLKNGRMQTAAVIDHRLNVFFDFHNAWDQDGAFKEKMSGVLFPSVSNHRQIIRAMMHPYVVLFDD